MLHAYFISHWVPGRINHFPLWLCRELISSTLLGIQCKVKTDNIPAPPGAWSLLASQVLMIFHKYSYTMTRGTWCYHLRTKKRKKKKRKLSWKIWRITVNYMKRGRKGNKIICKVPTGRKDYQSARARRPGRWEWKDHWEAYSWLSLENNTMVFLINPLHSSILINPFVSRER